MGKSCEQWEEIPVVQKTWQAFKNHSVQAYTRYQIRKRHAASTHGYIIAAKYVQETNTQMMVADALEVLSNAKTEDKEKIPNLTSINFTLP